MSISSAITNRTKDIFIIPSFGKMFLSNIDRHNRGLAIVINKGYFEITNLQTMLSLIDYCNEDTSDLILVGNLAKVKLLDGRIVYRQRIFFRDLSNLLACCKLFGVAIFVPKYISFTVNNLINCREELDFLEKYARKFRQSIDDYLIWCFKIQFAILLKEEHIACNLQSDINTFLRDKQGYLDRAPFLVRHYNIKKHISSLFYIRNTSDTRLFSPELNSYGYTDKNKLRDLQKGVFK